MSLFGSTSTSSSERPSGSSGTGFSFGSMSTSSSERPSSGFSFNFPSTSTSSSERPSGGFSFGSTSSTSSSGRPSGGFSFGSTSSTSSSGRPSSGFSFGSTSKLATGVDSLGIKSNVESLGGSSDGKVQAKVDSVSKVLLSRRKRVGTGHKRQIQKREAPDEVTTLTENVEPMFCEFRDAVTEPLSKVIANKASTAAIQLTISKLFDEYVRVSGMKPGAIESS